jgi:hypothetical protein
MPPKKLIKIEKEKILLAEGADAYYFFIWACQAFDASDIQVMDFGGIDNLGPYLKTLKEISGYEDVKTIAIVRDAESNPDGAVKSIKNALKNNGFSVPGEPFVFTECSPRVAFMILPGFESDSRDRAVLSKGTLEDLCLWMTENDPIRECVTLYIDCLKGKNIKIARPHKTSLHSYLSGRNDFVGLKIGEAAKAGAWDWNHPKLSIFGETIKKM